MTVCAEYEDKYYNSFENTDTLRVTVNQKASLEYDGFTLSNYVYQKDTTTLNLSFMNSGKCTVKNVKVEFEIDGLESGGTLFVGDIAEGESYTESVNLLASSDVLGDVEGVALITYEDEYGNSKTKTVTLSTTIKEEIVEDEEVVDETSQFEKICVRFWYLFLIVGVVFGATFGAGVVAMINSNKRKKEDEARL